MQKSTVLKALSFGDWEEEEVSFSICCQFCNRRIPLEEAKVFNNNYVGKECCWDESLQVFE